MILRDIFLLGYRTLVIRIWRELNHNFASLCLLLVFVDADREIQILHYDDLSIGLRSFNALVGFFLLLLTKN